MTPEEKRQQKLAAALQWLGPRWVFSPERRRLLNAQRDARNVTPLLWEHVADRRRGYPR